MAEAVAEAVGEEEFYRIGEDSEGGHVRALEVDLSWLQHQETRALSSGEANWKEMLKKAAAIWLLPPRLLPVGYMGPASNDIQPQG